MKYKEEYERLHESFARMRGAYEQSLGRIAELEAVVEQKNSVIENLKLDVGQLREALEKYGGHIDECEVIPACTCGLDDLLNVRSNDTVVRCSEPEVSDNITSSSQNVQVSCTCGE